MSQLNRQPLISVVTPVFNAERFLSETIESVRSQTYANFELILVIDSKSNDRSLEICQTLQKNDRRLKIVQDKRAVGSATNRNIGIDLAQGEYISFLDADDKWPPQRLEQLFHFAQQTNCPFVFSAFQRMSLDGKKLSPVVPVPKRVSYWDLLKINSIAIHTVLIRRDFLAKKRFPQVVHEDFALWLEILRPKKDQEAITALGLNQSLAYYRSVPGSVAHDKKRAALWRWKILRDFEKLGFFESLYYFCQYAIRASLLHLRSKV